ncbi:MAG: MTH938/NDUFAF3 family protein, partial [candidate division WOR-3 bacterium]
MIEAYQFGEIRVSGKNYHNDVIIYPDHIDSKWWRKQGHTLDIDDIKEVIDAEPDVIIVGTGQPGMMRVSDETLAKMRDMKIEMIVMPTEQA